MSYPIGTRTIETKPARQKHLYRLWVKTVDDREIEWSTEHPHHLARGPMLLARLSWRMRLLSDGTGIASMDG